MIVFDHMDKRWRSRRRHTNGAETYSRDLVEYQMSNWRDILGNRDVISTCPRLSQSAPGTCCRLAVQYLHEFPPTDPIDYARRIVRALRAEMVVFITAYRAYWQLLKDHGYHAVFIPMSIDVANVSLQRPTTSAGGIVWFGNIDRRKRRTYNNVLASVRAKGMDLATITRSRYRRAPLPQRDAWEMISGHKYGIAVGRCALEMFALGLKVFIAGRGIGGLVMNEDDWNKQIDTNFNARISTHSTNIGECLDALPTSTSFEIPDIRKMNHAAAFQAAGYA